MTWTWGQVPRRAYSVGLLVTISLLGAVGLSHRVWSTPTSSVIGGGADGIQKAWFMAWLTFALAHHHNPLWTTFLSPPGHPIDLMRNNAVPIWGMVMMPLTLLAGGLASFNVAMVLALATGPVAAALVLERYVSRAPIAWVSGLLYGFSPFALAEADLGHLPWVSLWFPPLVLALLDEVLIRQRRNPYGVGALLGLLVGVQLLINQESVATAALLAAIMISLLLATHPSALRRRWADSVRTLGTAVAIAVAISAPALWAEFLGPGHMVSGPDLSPAVFSGDLLGFVLPGSHQLLSSAWSSATVKRFTGDSADTTVYLGLPLLFALSMGWMQYRSDPRIRWTVILTVVSMVLTLGARLHVAGTIFPIPLPWVVLERLPLLGLALPSRIALFATLGATMCLCLVADRLASSGRVLGMATAITLLTASFVFLAPESALYSQRLQVPALFVAQRYRAAVRGGYLALAPVPTGSQATAMLWQMDSHFRFQLPWGYAIQAGSHGHAVVSSPTNALIAGIDVAAEGTTPSPSVTAMALRLLQEWRIQAVAVGPMAGQGGVIAWLTAALDRQPAWYGSVAVWRAGCAAHPGAGRPGARPLRCIGSRLW